MLYCLILEELFISAVFDILIYLAVAIIFIIKLFFVVGHDESDGSIGVGIKSAKSITNVKRVCDTDESANMAYHPQEFEYVAKLCLDNFESSNSETLKKIEDLPYKVNMKNFLIGAMKSFEALFSAYVLSDVDTLRKLVDDVMLVALSEKSMERARNDQVMCSKLLGVQNLTIKYIRCGGDEAWICLEIVSDQVVCIRNPEGTVVKGDPSKIVQVVDIVELHKSFDENDSRNDQWKFIRV